MRETEMHVSRAVKHAARAGWQRLPLVLLVLLVAALLPTRALAKDALSDRIRDVTYVDEWGREYTEQNCPVISSLDDWKWYKVFADAPSYQHVALSGQWGVDTLDFWPRAKTLILMDDCKVEAKHVSVHLSSSSPAVEHDFHIYGQKEGTGSLEVAHADDGHKVGFEVCLEATTQMSHTLAIHGGNISITDTNHTALQFTGLSSRFGTLSIRGGTLKATSEYQMGVWVGRNIEVSGGTLEGTGYAVGIMAAGDLIVSGGAIEGTATKPQGGPMGITANGITISEGIVTGTAMGKDGIGLHSDEKFVVSDGIVSGTGAGGGIINNDNPADITITGGMVDGKSLGDRPGIGSTKTHECNVLIKGGTVTGTSVRGAGIGSASDGEYAANIRIEGGKVRAQSHSGAGIGGGDNSAACRVAISGGTVERAESATGAGIGGGFGSSATVTITGGNVTAHASEDDSGFLSAGAAIGGGSSCTGYTVEISGSDTQVRATAESGAGIGGGDGGAAGSVNILGGTVYATSNGNGACIGSAYGGGPCTVSISDGRVYAGLFDGGGETDGAGIGGGESGDGGNITISGGEVYAQSVKGGAGIGGGYGGMGGTVNITGGAVNAQSTSGAGIGGGEDGAGGQVSISGGVVIASSQREGGGQAIGHGQGGADEGALALSVGRRVLEEIGRYVRVSASNDGRVDECRKNWVRIDGCDHRNTPTYYVPSSDGTKLEMHCALCADLIRSDAHHFECEVEEDDPSSLRIWCSAHKLYYRECPFGKSREDATVVTISGDDVTYDAQAHGVTFELWGHGRIPKEIIEMSVRYSSGSGASSDAAPVDAGTYRAVAQITLPWSSGGTISASYSIDKRPALVCPSDQMVLRGRALAQGVSHVALRSVDDEDQSGAVAGHVLSAVKLAPEGALTKSCDIEASGARIADADGKDVTANYDLSYRGAQAVVMDTVPDFTAPRPLLGLTYDGQKKALVSPGSSNEATIEYALAKEGPYSTSVPTAKNAGSYTVWWRVVRKAGGNATLGAVTAQAITATIAPRRVSVAWSGTSYTYDGQQHVPTCTVTNLVPGDACKVVVRGAERDAGSYTASAIELDNGNYTLWTGIQLSCDFTIAQREVRVSGITAQDKVYDATDAARLSYAGVTLSGRIAGDALTVTATGVFANVNAGPQTVNISDLTLGGSDAKNYVLAGSGQQTTATAQIAPRPIAVQALNQIILKDDVHSSDQRFATLSARDGYPLIEGHELGAVTIRAMSGTAERAPGDVGGFELVPSEVAIMAGEAPVTDNYAITYVSGGLIAMETVPSITPPQPRQLVYDGTEQTLVDPGTIEEGYSFQYAINVSGPFGTEIPSDTDAGDYEVFYRIVDASGTPLGQIAAQGISVHIGRRPVTVVPHEGQEKIYGDVDPTLSYRVENWAKPMEPLTGTLERASGEDVGAYAITQGSVVSGSGLGDPNPNPNYLITFEEGPHFAIRKREVMVSGIVAADKVYDGTTAVEFNEEDVSLENVLESDVEKLSFGGCEGAFADAAAGLDKEVYLWSLRLSGSVAHNYVAYGDQAVTASIAERPGKVVANDQTVLWGDEIQMGTSYAELSPFSNVQESGAAPGEALTSIALAPQGPVTSGGVITPSDAVISNGLGSETTANYDLRYEAGMLVVMDVAPDLTPPVAREGLVYDGTEHELVTGGTTDRGVIVYSLEKDGTYSESVPKVKAAGTYEVWWKVVLASDHSKQMGSVPLQCLSVTVRQRETELAWSGTEWWYDGREHVPTASVTNLVAGDECAVTVEGAQVAVGEHVATASGLSNQNYRLPAHATTSFVIKLADWVVPSEVVLGAGTPQVSCENLSEVAQLLVSDEERGLGASGVNVRVWLQVERSSESNLSDEEREALASCMRELGAQAGWYLDICVYKQVGEEITRVTKTPTPLRLAMPVPDELSKSSRTHYLIRGHGGEATVLASTAGATLEGQSDLFSPYLLAYRDPADKQDEDDETTPRQGANDATTPQQRSAATPQTGDFEYGISGIVAAALLALGLGLVVSRRGAR